MSGAVREGRRAGGLPYGYAPVPGRPGELTIEDAQADIVRRIFDEFLAGKSARAICIGLNRQGIASPRGGVWNTSTLNGCPRKGTGILHNAIYGGTLVWGKIPRVKDPETGRDVPRPAAAADWQSTPVPHLAIVSKEVFDAAQCGRRHRPGRPHLSRRPKHPLSGLLVCGACGAAMVRQGSDKTRKPRVQCAAVRNSGTCTHGRKYYIDIIAATLMRGLREQLAQPDLIREFVETYAAARAERLKKHRLAAIRLDHEATSVRRQIAALIDALANGRARIASIEDRLIGLEERLVKLDHARAEASAEDTPVTLHPAALQRYLACVDRLAAGDLGELGNESWAAMRELIGKVTVLPSIAPAPLQIEVSGRLAALTGRPTPPLGRMVGDFDENYGAGGPNWPLSPTIIWRIAA
jgi:hypothetical protein